MSYFEAAEEGRARKREVDWNEHDLWIEAVSAALTEVARRTLCPSIALTII